MTVIAPDASPTLAADEAARLTEFARACKAAARAVVLYPAGHPAVGVTLGRLAHLTAAERQAVPLVITVLADGLLLDGLAAARPDASLGELAASLHAHLIGQVTVHPGGSVDEWRRFLLLVGRPIDEVRAEGGFAAAWQAADGRHVEIAELDYAQVLRGGSTGVGGKWSDIVSHCLRRGGEALDAPGRQALYEASADPAALSELVTALDAQAQAGGHDEQSRAASLVGLLDDVVTSVTEHNPSQIDRALVAAADALSHVSPDLMATLLAHGKECSETPGLVDTVVSHMSDQTIAHFVAQHALVGGTPMDRLAQAFQVLVPEDRRDRVLSLARAEAASSATLDQSGFEQLWGGIAQKLLMSYSDKPFVSDQYGRELSRARTTALDVERVGDDPPERMEAWLSTLSAAELRRLDHSLVLDLLRLEADPERWATLMHPAVALVNDQLLVGDFESAGQTVEILLRERRETTHRPAATRALEGLAAGPLVRHVAEHLATLDDAQFEALRKWLVEIGNNLSRAIAEALTEESPDLTRERLTRLLVGFGSVGRLEIDRLRHSPSAAGRRAAVRLLAELGGHDALADLENLLADEDEKVARDAVHAMLDLKAEAAQTALAQAFADGAPPVRTALLGAAHGHDERATPVFVRVLATVDHRGPQAERFLEALAALGTIGDPTGVESLARALRRGEWWAPRRTAVLRRAAAGAMARIGSPAALAALDEAARTGSRGVRAAARAALAARPGGAGK